jgi:outer membrane protein assembly factor BamE
MNLPSFKHFLFIAVVAASVTACGNFLKPHRISIQQGNIISPDMINKLEIGMSKRQVEYILGTPLVRDSFNPDQWVYLYSFEHGATGLRLESKAHLTFSENALASIDTNLITKENEEVAEENPAEQVAKQESENLEKRLPNEREDSLNESGL